MQAHRFTPSNTLSTPRSLKEAAYGIGATQWEVIWDVVLPNSRAGVIGGIMLGLGRALGETMAVTFVVGNAHRIASSLLAPETSIKWLVGHSKGALAIGNALESLPLMATKGLTVITLGCPIAEGVPGATYHQFLGLFDALGQANAWWHRPETWTATDHSTNPKLPLSMSVGALI